MKLRDYLIITAYGALVFLLFLDNGTTLTKHEVYTVEPAREMIDADAPWAVQTFAGQVRTAKPPTMSWVIAGCMEIFNSRGPFVCRLPAALAAILIALAVAIVAQRLVGAPAGLLAGLATLTTYWLQYQGRLAQADIPMTAAVTIAMASLAWLLPRREGGTLLRPAAPGVSHSIPTRTLRWISIIFYAATGASFLIKGVGPLITLPAALTYGLWSRDQRVWRVLLWPPGLAIFGAFLLIWPATALATYPPIWHAWVDQTVGRLDGQVDTHTSPGLIGYIVGLPSYVYTAPLLLMPMTPALLLAIWHLRGRWRCSVAARFLISWTAPFFALITLSAFRNQHYVMPILPAASVGAAYGTLVWARALRRPRMALPILAGWFALCAIGVLVAQAWIGPRSDSYRPYADFAATTNAIVPDGTPVCLIGLGEAQVAYYLETIPVRIDKPEKTPLDQPMYAICDRRTFEQLDITHDVVELATAKRERDDAEEALVLAKLN